MLRDIVNTIKVWSELRKDSRSLGVWLYLMDHRDASMAQAEIEVFKEDVDWLIIIITCKVFGHDLEDDSYGGPDSGYIGVRCKRCGWSSGSVLY